MINYFNILVFKEIGEWTTTDNYDYNKFIFNNPSLKPTLEEIEIYNTEFNLYNCKTKAKILISESDWSVLPDVNIQNKNEFESYRSILRNYILNPVENPDFPGEPQPIWIIK